MSTKEVRPSWSGRYLLLVVIVSIITGLVGYALRYIFESQPLPNIVPLVIYNSGPSERKYSGPFTLNLEQDTLAWLSLLVTNEGSTEDHELEIEISFSPENIILNVQKKYIPELLRRYVVESRSEMAQFYERLAYLPSQSGLEYRFDLKQFIKTTDQFKHSVLSRARNWTKSSQIRTIYSRLFVLSLDISRCVQERKETQQPEVPRSGILIGGYDPLVMSNEVFQLVQKKGMISSSDAVEIKAIVESYKEGVLFGGINILKFNEVLINKLVLNRVVSVEQVASIVQKAKSAGGVMIGEYNVIILEVELLNALFQNGRITLQEGQCVIDKARGANN